MAASGHGAGLRTGRVHTMPSTLGLSVGNHPSPKFTGTYRDCLAGPQDVLGRELVGDVLTLQDLSLDPPVP